MDTRYWITARRHRQRKKNDVAGVPEGVQKNNSILAAYIGESTCGDKNDR